MAPDSLQKGLKLERDLVRPTSPGYLNPEGEGQIEGVALQDLGRKPALDAQGPRRFGPEIQPDLGLLAPLQIVT